MCARQGIDHGRSVNIPIIAELSWQRGYSIEICSSTEQTAWRPPQ
jgi:hypothetical protein